MNILRNYYLLTAQKIFSTMFPFPLICGEIKMINVLRKTFLFVVIFLSCMFTPIIASAQLEDKYYKRQPDDRFTLIHEFSYKVYGLKDEENQNEVAVIGPLSPCVGIIVTDGEKLIAFHKNYMNAVDPDIPGSLTQVIIDNLNIKDNPAKLIAGIYADDYKSSSLKEQHDNKSREETIKDITDALITIGFQEESIHNITYDISPFSYVIDPLLYVVIRIDDPYIFAENGVKKLKLANISPITEDVLNIFSESKTDHTITFDDIDCFDKQRILADSDFLKKLPDSVLYLYPPMHIKLYNTLPFYPLESEDKELAESLFSNHKERFWHGYVEIFSWWKDSPKTFLTSINSEVVGMLYKIIDGDKEGRLLNSMRDFAIMLNELSEEEISGGRDPRSLSDFIEFLNKRVTLEDRIKDFGGEL